MVYNLIFFLLQNTGDGSILWIPYWQTDDNFKNYNRKIREREREFVSLLQGLEVLEVQRCPVCRCKHLEEQGILLHLSEILERKLTYEFRWKK